MTATEALRLGVPVREWVVREGSGKFWPCETEEVARSTLENFEREAPELGPYLLLTRVCSQWEVVLWPI